MSLHNEWKELAETQRSEQEHNSFWTEYFSKEKSNYEVILESNTVDITGKLSDVAESYNMSSVEFTGFIDGINTSLESEVDLDDLTEESELNMKIDFEKLYYNMLNVKADWLYNLPQWDGILSEEKRKDIKKQFNTERIAVSNKIGRNDPCTCGSGKKFKKCCGA
jgi:hypothetical protein